MNFYASMQFLKFLYLNLVENLKSYFLIRFFILVSVWSIFKGIFFLSRYIGDRFEISLFTIGIYSYIGTFLDLWILASMVALFIVFSIKILRYAPYRT